MEFLGQGGTTYSFYSVAKDYVGHVEGAPETPDATIMFGLWHNVWQPCDVNGDTYVSPVDVLWVITHLNTMGSGPPPGYPEIAPPYYDVSGDGNVSPIDVLLVITYLNSEQSVGSAAEGEAIIPPAGSEAVNGFALPPQRPLAETMNAAPPEHTPTSDLDAHCDEYLLLPLATSDYEAMLQSRWSRQQPVKRALEELLEDTSLEDNTDLEDLLEIMAGDDLRR